MTKKIILYVCLSLLIPCSLLGCSVKSQETPEPEKTDPILYEKTISDFDPIVTETANETIAEITESTSVQTQCETFRQSVSSTGTPTVGDNPKSDQKTVLWEAPNGELFYKEDAVLEGSVLAIEKALYRPSTGTFYDSFTNPELFDPETYDFLGELIEYDESDWRCIQSGNAVNGYCVKKAETLFNINDDGYLREDGYIPLSNSIVFEDDITLTGYLSYYPDDEPLYIQGGDLFFLPDQSYEGMPLVNYYPYCNAKSGKKYFDDEDEILLPVFYSDSISISVGNLFTDYADSETLKQIIEDDEKTRDIIRVEMTLGELSLTFHDMMIWGGASGKIISVKEIE